MRIDDGGCDDVPVTCPYLMLHSSPQRYACAVATAARPLAALRPCALHLSARCWTHLATHLNEPPAGLNNKSLPHCRTKKKKSLASSQQNLQYLFPPSSYQIACLELLAAAAHWPAGPRATRGAQAKEKKKTSGCAAEKRVSGIVIGWACSLGLGHESGRRFFAPPQAFFFSLLPRVAEKKKSSSLSACTPLRPPPFKSPPPTIRFRIFSLLLLFVSHTRFKHPICEFVCTASLFSFDDGHSAFHHWGASSPSSSSSSSFVEHYQLTLSLAADVLVKNFSNTTKHFTNRQNG